MKKKKDKLPDAGVKAHLGGEGVLHRRGGGGGGLANTEKKPGSRTKHVAIPAPVTGTKASTPPPREKERSRGG